VGVYTQELDPKTRGRYCSFAYSACHSAFYRQHNQFREFRGFIEAANATPRVLSPPLRKFLRGASAYHYGMIMLQKTSSESLSNITRSQDSDFHVSVSPCNRFRRPAYNLLK
jgi:hypothetical protein